MPLYNHHYLSPLQSYTSEDANDKHYNFSVSLIIRKKFTILLIIKEHVPHIYASLFIRRVSLMNIVRSCLKITCPPPEVQQLLHLARKLLSPSTNQDFWRLVIYARVQLRLRNFRDIRVNLTWNTQLTCPRRRFDEFDASATLSSTISVLFRRTRWSSATNLIVTSVEVNHINTRNIAYRNGRNKYKMFGLAKISFGKFQNNISSFIWPEFLVTKTKYASV